MSLTDEQMGRIMGELLVHEDLNDGMNKFIRGMIGKMKDEGIFTLIVKGQGIAQCYEKPLWRAFGAFAVEFLGMPADAMPLYDSGGRWSRKASRILVFIMRVGNFGHNRDLSYYRKYPYVIRKAVSFGYRVGDVCRHARIFPLDSLRFFPRITFEGLRSAARGE